tara:strand:- start:633 stop:1097 length:465 start_codon:yes stop_codon:yes gene_type:complete
MKKIIFFLLILAVTNCSTKKLEKSHGYINLDKKKEEITIGKTNKNDILNIFGPPSTVSTFDENIWIFIELKKVNRSIAKLGKKRIEKNNTLIVKFDNRNLVSNVDFIDIQNLNKIKLSQNTSEKEYTNNSMLYSILTSLREKINAPVRRRQNKK